MREERVAVRRVVRPQTDPAEVVPAAAAHVLAVLSAQCANLFGAANRLGLVWLLSVCAAKSDTERTVGFRCTAEWNSAQRSKIIPHIAAPLFDLRRAARAPLRV